MGTRNFRVFARPSQFLTLVEQEMINVQGHSVYQCILEDCQPSTGMKLWEVQRPPEGRSCLISMTPSETDIPRRNHRTHADDDPPPGQALGRAGAPDGLSARSS